MYYYQYIINYIIVYPTPDKKVVNTIFLTHQYHYHHVRKLHKQIQYIESEEF